MKKAKDAARDVIALFLADATLPEGVSVEEQAKNQVDAYLQGVVQELADALQAARTAGVGTGKATVAIVRVHDDRWKGFAHRLEHLPAVVIGEDLKGRFKTATIDVLGGELAAVAWAAPKSAAQIAEEKAKANKDRPNKSHKGGKGRDRRNDRRSARPVTP